MATALLFAFFFFRAHLTSMVSSIFYHRHPERSEGSVDRDFSPTAQNDEFFRYAYF